MIEILIPGPLTTIQDLGRPGLAHLGVGRSGAADRPSLRLANRLVGNPEGAAGLELTHGGLTARFTRHTLVALTGAPCPARIDGRPVDMYAPLSAAPGQRLRIGHPAHGLRTYLAIRGGIDVPEVLGARATDVLAGLGPAPLEPGQTLPIGTTALPHPAIDLAPQSPWPDQPVLRVTPGPRDDWFTPGALTQLTSAAYEVTEHSNRVGLRLRGPALQRRVPRELPPEPMVPGALQVPPDGQPVLFLADHPVTGGYPVIGVVTTTDLPLAAQTRPGQHITFRLFRGRGRTRT
ncbi:biotin-dependent carboxyltransferase family protein [Streptomyces gobiensis]|uniref:5-oxoprolinase subunit C family protein n=1 Tax=Streptomyces gobiensis TaxID=2875706 RepID=UPI001E5BD066|nr:biotin-dependent carboxyltransferase family protein [Streptomyces gobiensis]UGY93304.1 biotin-dependent carboxyltransferase family protein [Streptomyces gobiensis]